MYATLSDVKRVLNISEESVDDERDAKIRASLLAMESWVAGKLDGLSDKGDQVAAFFDIAEDATIHMPASDITVTKVKVFEYPSAAGIALSAVELGFGHGYDLTDDGDVLLRPTLGVSPFEGAAASRVLRYYSRVEVFYEGTGVIPQHVTEGVAFLAAGYFEDAPRTLAGLRSEKIGDYSYTRDTADESGEKSYVAQGLWFLKPSMRQARLSVI